MTRPARIAVAHYSATGNVHRLAHALAEGYTSGKRVEGPDEKALAVAHYQGQRLGRYAAVVAVGGLRPGLLSARAR